MLTFFVVEIKRKGASKWDCFLRLRNICKKLSVYLLKGSKCLDTYWLISTCRPLWAGCHITLRIQKTNGKSVLLTELRLALNGLNCCLYYWINKQNKKQIQLYLEKARRRRTRNYRGCMALLCTLLLVIQKSPNRTKLKYNFPKSQAEKALVNWNVLALPTTKIVQKYRIKRNPEKLCFNILFGRYYLATTQSSLLKPLPLHPPFPDRVFFKFDKLEYLNTNSLRISSAALQFQNLKRTNQ